METDMFQETAIPAQYTEKLADFFKVMGEESRVRIIYALSHAPELCVTDLSESLEMTQSSVSHQLKLLKLNGLVKSRRDGKNMYYSLDDEHVLELLQVALAHVGHKVEEGSL